MYICTPSTKGFGVLKLLREAAVMELVDMLDLGLSLIISVKILKCGRGGIGRHVRLRI